MTLMAKDHLMIVSRGVVYDGLSTRVGLLAGNDR